MANRATLPLGLVPALYVAVLGAWLGAGRSARSASWLDGSPSAARWIEAREIGDRRAPAGRIEISGRSVEAGGKKIWRGDAKVSVVVEDAAPPGEVASGLADWTLQVGGQPTLREWLQGPFQTGSYELTVEARDQAGNAARIGPVTFQVDASAPAISWEVVASPGAAPLPWDGRVSALEWKGVDPTWLVWRWSRPEEEMAPLPLRWSGGGTAAGAAEILVIADQAVSFGGEVEERVAAGAALRLRFSDVGGDLARASIHRDPGGSRQAGQATLMLEARDLLGNETRLTVPLLWP